MNTLSFKITNNSHEHITASLFNPLDDPNENISIEVNNGNVTYEHICKFTTATEYFLSVMYSSNNRQLFFYRFNIMGHKFQIEPFLTIDRQPRQRIAQDFDDWEYAEIWNPKKWNIADTGEHFIAGLHGFVEIEMNPKQVFEITLAIQKHIPL